MTPEELRLCAILLTVADKTFSALWYCVKDRLRKALPSVGIEANPPALDRAGLLLAADELSGLFPTGAKAAPGTVRAGEKPPAWVAIRRRLLAKMKRGGPFTGLEALAREIGCKVGLVRKAIWYTKELAAWKQRKPKAPKRWQGYVNEDNEIVLEERPDPQPQEPADTLTPEDAERHFAAIVAQAERAGDTQNLARLKALDAKQRRTAARVYRDCFIDSD